MLWEDRDFSIAILQAVVNGLWVLLPLIPAIVIYRIFPDTKVAISGPLQALTVRASGAFAAYLVVFLATYPLIDELNENLKRMYDSQWVVSGYVVVRDENGRAIRLGQGGPALTVALRPDIITLAGNRFEIIVPEINNRVPSLLVGYPGYGEHTITLTGRDESHPVRIDRRRHEIEIVSPVEIQREACRGPGC